MKKIILINSLKGLAALKNIFIRGDSGELLHKSVLLGEKNKKKLQKNKTIPLLTHSFGIKNFTSDLGAFRGTPALLFSHDSKNNKKADNLPEKFKLIESQKYRGWESLIHDTSSNPTLSEETLLQTFNLWWDKIITPYVTRNPNIKINAQLVGNYQDLGYLSLSKISFGITSEDKEDLWDAWTGYLSILDEYYKKEALKSLAIKFKIVEGEEASKMSRKLIASSKKLMNRPSLKIGGYNLPISYNYNHWGKIITNKYNTETGNRYVTMYKYDSPMIFRINSFVDTETGQLSNKVQLYNKNVLIAQWLDKFGESNYNLNSKIIKNDEIEKEEMKESSFTRSFSWPNKREYVYKNGEQIAMINSPSKVSFLKERKEHKKVSDKFITMDLETRVKNNGCMEAIACSWHDGKITQSFYLSDYENSDSLLKAALKSIMIKKYNGWKLYFHNFSYFDAVFLMKIISELSTDVKPIIRDNRIIQLIMKYDNNEKNKGTITFVDSYNLLPSSLDALAKNFKVENKSFFPFAFVNDPSVSLDYIGNVPDLKYFINTKHKKDPKKYLELENNYNKYKNSFPNKEWDLKKELIKYCEQDVRTLHQVISNSAKEIFNMFKLDETKFCTLPSLAFGVYRSKYLEKNEIPLIKGKIYNDIRESYLGGLVDVYKPSAKNVNAYDVNSLYPYAMLTCPMPVGQPIYFEGDPHNFSDDPFGFFYVSVTSPKDLNIPILPTRVKDKKGMRTICPLGSWKGWYFSEEIKNAMKYGYKFKIHKGYLFKKQIIFKEYVNTLYEKKKTSKGTPWYGISKMLLNSLYGRFGMTLDHTEYKIITEEETINFINSPQIDDIDLIDFKNGKLMISYQKNEDLDQEQEINASVPVAAAVTSWSRIIMSKYLIDYKDQICYIDTDGIKMTGELDPSLVGNEIGQMKLEGTFSEAVFLAPKVYGLLDSRFSKGTIEGWEAQTVKIKGVKMPISYWELKTLLTKSSEGIKISQDKWFRDFEAGTIRVKDEIYTLIVTDTKREIVWDSCGIFVDTKPFIIKNKELVKQDQQILYYLPNPYNN